MCPTRGSGASPTSGISEILPVSNSIFIIEFATGLRGSISLKGLLDEKVTHRSVRCKGLTHPPKIYPMSSTTERVWDDLGTGGAGILDQTARLIMSSIRFTENLMGRGTSKKDRSDYLAPLQCRPFNVILVWHGCATSLPSEFGWSLPRSNND